MARRMAKHERWRQTQVQRREGSGEVEGREEQASGSHGCRAGQGWYGQWARGERKEPAQHGAPTNDVRQRQSADAAHTLARVSFRPVVTCYPYCPYTSSPPTPARPPNNTPTILDESAISIPGLPIRRSLHLRRHVCDHAPYRRSFRHGYPRTKDRCNTRHPRYLKHSTRTRAFHSLQEIVLPTFPPA